MSIYASYRRLSPAEWETLQEDSKAAAQYFGMLDDDLDATDEEYDDTIVAHAEALGNDPCYLNITNDWQAIHFLLTGEFAFPDTCNVPPPLRNVVMGGHETRFEATYGMVRFLSPEEVKEVAEALGKISDGELRAKFDPAAFNAARIYRGQQWSKSDLEPLMETYHQIQVFFAAASNEGDVVLLSSD